MTKDSILRKAYIRTAAYSLLYALLLTIVVFVSSYLHFKGLKLQEFNNKIVSISHSLSRNVITSNYPSIIREIQQKTNLQEILLVNDSCSFLAGTSLVTTKCEFLDKNFETIKTQINSENVTYHYKLNYSFIVFAKNNSSALIIIYLFFFSITSIILVNFFRISTLKPISKIKKQIELNDINLATVEFDFLGDKLKDLENIIRNNEKEKTHYNLARQVVHDIRNPLEHLKILSKSKEINPDSIQQVIKEIDYQINGLLNYTKNKQNNLFIDSLLYELRDEAYKLFNVELQITTPSDSLNIISAIHEFELKNILMNLCRNSREAGASQIEIKSSVKGNMFTLVVNDNGSGVQNHLLQQIFQPNFTTKEKGNGIGLSSIRKNLEKIGGRITCKMISSGSSFQIDIPVLESIHRSVKKAVFIDDDKFLQISWKNKAEKIGVTLKTYSKVCHFLSESHLYEDDINIYIDSDLGIEGKGEDLSESISLQGFKNIYLATSYSDIDLKNYPWIVSQIPKSSPF